MNTNQINAKKELFIRAMEKDNKDLIHAVAPAEMMTIIHKCDPLHHHNGENHLLEISNADELCFDDYCFDNHCGESDYMVARDTFLMDPVRAELNKIKYEKGLITDDELLAFALFLVGDSLIVKEHEEDEDIDYRATANLVNHVASRLKFLASCMNLARYDMLNTVIQFVRQEMDTPIDTSYCLDEVEMKDSGVLNYYDRMTNVKAFTRLHDMEEGLRVLARKASEKMLEEYRKKVGDKKIESEEEPLVERDFEG